MTESELFEKLNAATNALEQFERENGGLERLRIYKELVKERLGEIQKRSHQMQASGNVCPLCHGSGRS